MVPGEIHKETEQCLSLGREVGNWGRPKQQAFLVQKYFEFSIKNCVLPTFSGSFSSDALDKR